MNNTMAAGCGILVLFLCGTAFSAQPKEPKTVITGEQMEILQGGNTVIFSGGSKVTRGESVLTAEKLVQNKKSKSVTAEGNITFKSVSKDNEPVEGRSEKARYDTDQGQAELWEGRPEIIYHVKDSTRPVQLTADLIRFDEKKEEIFASGEVVVVSSSANAHSPEALFEQKERKVTLTGTAPQPELVYTNEDQPGKYRADKITLFVDRKKAFLEGNVRTRVTVKELDQKK